MKKNIMFILTVFTITLLLTATIPTCSESFTADDPTPPDQPSSGPGGSNYSHYGVRKTRYRFGAKQYWIFEPFGPKPESAPLIVFNHGWSAIFPIYYRDWTYQICLQ